MCLFLCFTRIIHDVTEIIHGIMEITHDVTEITHDVMRITHGITEKFSRKFEGNAVK